MTKEIAINRIKEIERCTPIHTEDDVKDCKALEMAIQALSQEPSRDIEEIAEVMKCDADAETKCKMISNILTAKPHYFEEQKPCDDAISREDVLAEITRFSTEEGASVECQQLYCDVNNLPSVTQKSGKWIVYNYPAHECVYCSNCKTEYYEEDLYLGGSEFPKFCPNCGARMESEDRE